MKKMVQRSILASLAIALSIGVTGCADDIMPELTDLETSRLFSATDLEARIVNQTGIRLTWKAVKEADSYTVEVYEGETIDAAAQPIQTISNIAMQDLPYVITGLEGETTYSVQVKAIGQNIADSKWIHTTIATEVEQLFQPVDLAEIEADQVVLRWAAGQTASQIVLQPGGITHILTPEEISAGIATITGLRPETAYEARLIHQAKTRGVITFTTLLDLGGAIAVNPEDNLVQMISLANEGDVFALMPGDYTVQDIAIAKTISLRAARPADRPVISGAVFRVSDGASLELKDLIFDGTTAKDGNQMIIYDAGTFDRLLIEDCEVSNYVKGALYVNTATLIQSVKIKGNIYANIECNGGDFIDFRNGIAKAFEFSHNTVYNSALSRDFFRMDAGGSTNFPSTISVLNIHNNTFNNVSNGNNRRILYIRLTSHQIHFTKNILANTDGYYTNQATTTITTIRQNNYYNASNFVSSTQSNAKNDPGPYTTLNPGFKDPQEGDFTLQNEELIFQGIGDPRWFR